MKSIFIAATASLIFAPSALALAHPAPQSINPGGPIQPCTTSTCTFPKITSGPTSTAYEATITETSSLNCNGCGAVEVGQCIYVPIPISFTTTVTAWEPLTTTTYVCEPSKTPGSY